LPYHTHNDGVPCSNQGVATIFGRREHAVRGVGSRLGPIAYHGVRSRPLTSIRLAIDALTTPKKYQLNEGSPAAHRDCGVGIPRKTLAYQAVLLAPLREIPPCTRGARDGENIQVFNGDSNQGVATIFRLLRTAIAALEFRARRSRRRK